MAGGWARDGAVQDQIDASVEDAVERTRRRLPRGESLLRVQGVRRRDTGRPARGAARGAPLRRVSERARRAGHAAHRLQPSGEQGQPAEVVGSGQNQFRLASMSTRGGFATNACGKVSRPCCLRIRRVSWLTLVPNAVSQAPRHRFTIANELAYALSDARRRSAGNSGPTRGPDTSEST